MGEVQLAIRVGAVELSIPLLRHAPVSAYLHDRDSVEDTPTRLGVRVERFDHEPAIRVRSAHVFPTHDDTIPATDMAVKFRDSDATLMQRRTGFSLYER